MTIALCLGGSRSVWSDLERAQALIGDRPHIIIACNYAGIQYPGRLDAWATLHPELFRKWRRQRAEAGCNTDYRAFTDQPGSAAEVVPWRWRGSSGLYMAQIALERMGASLAILCGVPMDDTGGHIARSGDWPDSHHYRPAFEAAKLEGLPIRSMSGWTADLFGTPHDLFGARNMETQDMAWVTFTDDFDYYPTDNSTISYLKGQTLSVREECAAAAVLAGKAERQKTPRRGEKPVNDDAPKGE